MTRRITRNATDCEKLSTCQKLALQDTMSATEPLLRGTVITTLSLVCQGAGNYVADRRLRIGLDPLQSVRTQMRCASVFLRLVCVSLLPVVNFPRPNP